MDRIVNKKVKFSPSDLNRIKLHAPPETATLSAAARKRLKQQCNNRANWSDGGNWIGSGAPPTCSGKRLTGSSTIIYTFPTDNAAFKWNAEWEKSIRQTGHLATGVAAVTVGLVTGGWGGVGVGIVASIVKDELQAQVSYPKVARGWTYSFTVTHIYKWSPHPYGKSGYIQEYTGFAYDTEQTPHYKSLTKVGMGFDSFPEALAMKLASAPGKIHNVVYGT